MGYRPAPCTDAERGGHTAVQGSAKVRHPVANMVLQLHRTEPSHAGQTLSKVPRPARHMHKQQPISSAAQVALLLCKHRAGTN